MWVIITTIFQYFLYGALPGYILLRLVSYKRQTVTLAEVFVWSSLSHPLTAFIALIFSLLGGSLSQAARFFDILWLILLSLFIFRLYRSPRSGLKGYRMQWDIFLSLVGVVLLFFPMLSVRNWFAYHGFWHSGIVESLLASKFPPENPGFAGEPIAYVWSYNLWVAFMVVKTGAPPIFINLLSHIHLLISLLGLSILMTSTWAYGGKQRTWGFWLLLGSINIGAFIHLAPHLTAWLVSAEGLFASYQRHAAGSLQPLLVLTNSIFGLPIFYKGWSFLTKFFNFTAMAHGIIFFYIFAWSLNCLFEQQRSLANWGIYAMALLGLLLFYPVFILFAILFALLYIFFYFLKGRHQMDLLLLVKCVLLSALLCALCWPYFLLIGAETGTSGVPIFSLSFSLEYLWIYAIGPFWPLVPLVLYWIFKIRPVTSNTGQAAFLSAGLSASALAPVLIFIAGGPSNYKYMYLAAIFVTWSSYAALMAWNRDASKRRWSLWILYASLALGPILLTVAGWSLGPWFRDSHFLMVNREIKYRGPAGWSEVIEWTSRYAQKDGVLLIPLAATDSKASTTYTLVALTGKSLYVVNDRTWVGGYAEYGKRSLLAKQVWGVDRGVSDTVRLSPDLDGRPLYLIYSEDVQVTTDFYNQLVGPIQDLKFFPGANMPEHLEALDFRVKQVYNQDDFKVLELIHNKHFNRP